MTFNITFSCYYTYQVEVEGDAEKYEDFSDEMEEEVFERAYDEFCIMRRSPIADLCYDEVEVEAL